MPVGASVRSAPASPSCTHNAQQVGKRDSTCGCPSAGTAGPRTGGSRTCRPQPSTAVGGRLLPGGRPGRAFGQRGEPLWLPSAPRLGLVVGLRRPTQGSYLHIEPRIHPSVCLHVATRPVHWPPRAAARHRDDRSFFCYYRWADRVSPSIRWPETGGMGRQAHQAAQQGKKSGGAAESGRERDLGASRWARDPPCGRPVGPARTAKRTVRQEGRGHAGTAADRKGPGNSVSRPWSVSEGE